MPLCRAPVRKWTEEAREGAQPCLSLKTKGHRPYRSVKCNLHTLSESHSEKNHISASGSGSPNVCKRIETWRAALEATSIEMKKRWLEMISFQICICPNPNSITHSFRTQCLADIRCYGRQNIVMAKSMGSGARLPSWSWISWGN